MKTRIKNLIKFYLPIFLMLVIASSCSDDDDNNPVNQQEDVPEEVVAVIGSSMGESTGGLAAQVSMAGNVAGAYGNVVNKHNPINYVAKDTTVNLSDTLTVFNKTYIYNYTITLTYPEALSDNTLPFAFTSSGSYQSPKINSTSSANAEWSIGNIISIQPFVMNGSYNRNGTQNTDYLVPHVITSSLEVTYTNIEFARVTHEILGGTASMTISGTFDAVDYSYTADIVFNGDGTATITIGGQSYTVDLQTGEIS